MIAYLDISNDVNTLGCGKFTVFEVGIKDYIVPGKLTIIDSYAKEDLSG